VFCDHLTGVANRRAFFEAGRAGTDRNRRTPRPTALILFDADHFKQINDRHGHPAGDACCASWAALRDTFRQVDVVARVGGEEFAVLLPSSTLAGAAAVAERLRQLVSQASRRCEAPSRSPIRSAPASPPWRRRDHRPGHPDQARRPGAVRRQGERPQPRRAWLEPETAMQAEADQADKLDAYEALVQFLYRAPIGLVQASLDGTVDMLNPMSSTC
jgi:diguanylate cyclase (GGDEF)-like protein